MTASKSRSSLNKEAELAARRADIKRLAYEHMKKELEDAKLELAMVEAKNDKPQSTLRRSREPHHKATKSEAKTPCKS